MAFLERVNEFVWGPTTLVLLVGTGIYLTLILKGYTIRSLYLACTLAFSRKQDKSSPGEITNFEALMTSLAAAMGTGNIAGVATAITLGGPGALFWMWVSAFFGMATKYAEAVLAVRYRRKDSNQKWVGGPMYYIEAGLNCKWLACLFALFGSLCAFGIGNLVQVNSIAHSLQDAHSVSPTITGVVCSLLMGLVVLGGIKSIGKVNAVLVPTMACAYMFGAFLIIGFNLDLVVPALSQVLRDAWSGTSAAGGFAGASVMAAIRYGFARGVFSNEAGLGSSPIVSAAAKVSLPGTQGLVSMCSTFIDTIVVCTVTGVVLLISDLWKQGLTGPVLTATTFEQLLSFGDLIVHYGVIFFAFSTTLAWAYYGEKCAVYLLGTKIEKPYRLIFVGMAFVGSVSDLPVVWTIADILNGLMAWPNLVALILLSREVVLEKNHFVQDAASS